MRQEVRRRRFSVSDTVGQFFKCSHYSMNRKDFRRIFHRFGRTDGLSRESGRPTAYGGAGSSALSRGIKTGIAVGDACRIFRMVGWQSLCNTTHDRFSDGSQLPVRPDRRRFSELSARLRKTSVPCAPRFRTPCRRRSQGFGRCRYCARTRNRCISALRRCSRRRPCRRAAARAKQYLIILRRHRAHLSALVRRGGLAAVEMAAP